MAMRTSQARLIAVVGVLFACVWQDMAPGFWNPAALADDGLLAEPEYFELGTPSLVEPLPVAVPLPEPWALDILPIGLIYRPYLAGPKEPRTGTQFVYSEAAGWNFDTSIGGQWGLFRLGTEDPAFPLGVQLDFEAAVQMRQNNPLALRVLSSDVRVGFPLSFSRNNHQTKLAVYFIRAHPDDDAFPNLGDDEFFQRQALVLGHSIYLTNRLRIYGEIGYALRSNVSEQWEVQFGAEYAPVIPTGFLGAPFLAANAYLRQEANFGGTLTLQGGWSWRNKQGRLLRIGGHYANGMSNQFSLHDKYEQQIGVGIWHDF